MRPKTFSLKEVTGVVSFNDTARFEHDVDAALARAGLTPLQREVVLYRLEDMTEGQISVKLHKPLKVVRCSLSQARAKIEALLAAAEAEAREFPRRLLFCVRDRRTYDERPEGVRGVTPDRSSQRFQGAPQVTEDDARLEQDLPSALKMGEASLRAVLVPR
jgi:hypothetical protein